MAAGAIPCSSRHHRTIAKVATDAMRSMIGLGAHPTVIARIAPPPAHLKLTAGFIPTSARFNFAKNFETFSGGRSLGSNVGAPQKMNMTVGASHARWSEPVYLRIGYGMPETIRSPKEALNHLLFRWPAMRGEKYQSAANLCGAANGNPFLVEQARELFVEACVEADVLD